MNVSITHSGTRKKVTVSCTKKGVVSFIQRPKKAITIEINRDGLSAYQIAVRNGYTGTESEYAAESIHPQIDFTAYYILSKS